MDGSPQLLTDVKFTQLRKGGYDPQEVDNYLERINDAVAKLADKLRAATEQAEAAQAQLADARRSQAAAESESERLRVGAPAPVPADEELAKVLVLAQRAADQAIEEANATATKTVADARAKSVNLLADAEQERERLLVKAHKKADAAALDRARELTQQVDALAAARADLEADVVALGAHLDAERERLRERVESVRSALDDPSGLRLGPTPELHDVAVPAVDLPGLGATEDEASARPAGRLDRADQDPAVADDGAAIEATPTGNVEAVVLADDSSEPTPSSEMATDDEAAVEPAAELAALPDTVAMAAMTASDGPAADAAPTPPRPELVPLVAPEEAALPEPPADTTINLTDPVSHPQSPSPQPGEPKQVEAQLFVGDSSVENRAIVDSTSANSGDLFARETDSPLGEPDEQADAAMRAFFERDLDDPSIVKGGRFGRRR